MIIALAFIILPWGFKKSFIFFILRVELVEQKAVCKVKSSKVMTYYQNYLRIYIYTCLILFLFSLILELFFQPVFSQFSLMISFAGLIQYFHYIVILK